MPKGILIVDDNSTIRKALRAYLDHWPGFKVCGEATSGREAIELARELDPDLVVLDISMPEMNGMDAICVLRTLIPAVPILVYTLFSDSFLADEALDAGANAVISKAEPLQHLLDTVKMLLKPAA